MRITQLDDNEFVAADAFFGQEDRTQEINIAQRPSKRESINELSAIKDKLSALERLDRPMMSMNNTRRVTRSYVLDTENKTINESLIGAITMKPSTTTANLQNRRDSNPMPSLLYTASNLTSSLTLKQSNPAKRESFPQPKLFSPSKISSTAIMSRRASRVHVPFTATTAAIPERDTHPTPIAEIPPASTTSSHSASKAVNMSTATLYASAESNPSDSIQNDSLTALRNAVNALKNTPFAHAAGITSSIEPQKKTSGSSNSIYARNTPSPASLSSGINRLSSFTDDQQQDIKESTPIEPRRIASSIAAPSPIGTEYDGDDVVMDDATPVAHSTATASTAPRSSTRFRMEALRQGITPMASRGAKNRRNTEETKKKIEELSPDTLNLNTSNPLAISSQNQASLSATAVLAVDSPTMSNGSSVSNNPLFAGTPSHPTPPSVSVMARGMNSAVPATAQKTPSTGGFSAASEGIKLAEQLQEAAEQLSTPLVGSASGGHTREEETSSFQFKDDVAALLQALDVSTPLGNSSSNNNNNSTAYYNHTNNNNCTPLTMVQPLTGAAAARALADASTEERPKPVARRKSSLSPGNTAVLDLAGFDANGERSLPTMPTPLLPGTMQHHHHADVFSSPPPGSIPIGQHKSWSNGVGISGAENIAELKQRIADLEAEREEAGSLLSGYQGSIAELQDQHSAAVVRMQSEMAMLKNEAERLRTERGEIQGQFESLYNDKYVPLKSEAATLRRNVDAWRSQLEEGENAKKRAATLEQELLAAQKATTAAQKGLEAAQAEAAAAREAQRIAEKRAMETASLIEESERKWASKYEAESKRAEQTLAANAAEIKTWRQKHDALSHNHDQLVHRIQVIQAGKERKEAEMIRKEEEICSLQVKYDLVEHTLSQFKAENQKFAGVKEQWKAEIAALRQQVAEKEAEKQQVLALSNELLAELEKANNRIDRGRVAGGN